MTTTSPTPTIGKILLGQALAQAHFFNYIILIIGALAMLIPFV
ncbi:MAG: hypothetical protein AAF702_04840 [Chloroflexota bacterium]